MQIRLRATGAVMFEDELRRWAKENGGPAWDRTTPEVLEALGADPVFEGPQAQPTRYQTAIQDGVEQIDGKWYTKYNVVDMDAAGIAAKNEQIKQGIISAAQARLDAFAQTRHYDDIKSASDYAGCSVPKFDIEGTYCRDARALTWARLYELLAEVEAGTRPMPTGFADIENELPPLVWPE
jgi:hypothetical protein